MDNGFIPISKRIKMEPERKIEILNAILETYLRKTLTVKQISEFKREVGNVTKYPEMRAINATTDEIFEIFKPLIKKVTTEQLKRL